MGRVLFVDSDDYLSYYYTALFSSFQRTLSGAGYLVSRVTCPVGKGGAAVERLNEAMGQHFDLVVLPFHDKTIVAAVERSGSRYLIATKAGFSRPGCVECFEVDCSCAVRSAPNRVGRLPLHLRQDVRNVSPRFRNFTDFPIPKGFVV